VRRNHNLGMSPIRAGLLALFLAAVVTYFGFTKAIPLRHHFEIQAVVTNSNLLRPRSPVRIAGVNVGEVVKTARYKKTNLSVLTLRINDDGQPIHRDATVKVRPRLFLEGNFYVDLKPGTPQTGKLDDRGLIPVSQTSVPTQLDQVLTALQTDSRDSLQETLQGLGDAFNAKPTAAEDAAQDPAVRGMSGGQALNEALKTSPRSLKQGSQVFGALLGPHPHDLSKTVKGLTKAFTALADEQDDLGDFVEDFNKTMAMTAAHSAQLRAVVQDLGPTVRHASDAFTTLNASMPALRGYAHELAVSLHEVPSTVAAAKPWLAQSKALLGDDELGGLLDELQPATANLAQLGHATREWLPSIDLVNRCATDVLIPTGNLKVEDGALSTGMENYKEFFHSLVGQASEGAGFDGNGGFLRLQASGGASTIRTGKSNYTGQAYIGKPTLEPLMTRPAYGNQLPPYDRSVACKDNPVPTINDAASKGPADGQRANAAAPDPDDVDNGGGGS
jgi:phospholipid/cholesterol/gamma-HCH transport system substrate-binding protein